jgi:hypothetical protein
VRVEGSLAGLGSPLVVQLGRPVDRVRAFVTTHGASQASGRAVAEILGLI